MSNPFHGLGSLSAERARRRREHFKVGVYAALVAVALLVVGLLIQGCRDHHSPGEAANEDGAGAAANPASPPPLAAPAQPETNSTIPLAAAPAAQPSADAASALPAPAPTPSAETPPAHPAPAPAVYVVKSGDTLGRIARTHHTSVRALKAVNGLKSDRIVVGEKLKLPRATAATPAQY